MPARSDLEAQPESDGLAESFQNSKEPRNPLSHLAAQCTHAVRNVFPGEPLREQDGHVQCTRQAVDRLDAQPEQRTDPHVPVGVTSKAAALQVEGVQSGEEEAIVAEAAKVKAKFASLDAKTEVVLRFDFMNETDTKATELQLTSYTMALYIRCPPLYVLQVASSAMFAATLLGLAVLLAEFTSKMKAVNGIPNCTVHMPHWPYCVSITTVNSQGSNIGMCTQDASSKRFRVNVVSVWNTAIGAVCLVLMTAILSVFAWRVVQARQQKKSWCV